MTNVRVLRTDGSPPPELAPEAPDWSYILALVALISVGLVMVYSTTALDQGIGAVEKTALVLTVVGIPGLLAGALLPLRFWRKATLWMLVGCFIALVALEFMPESIAPLINGARRWIKLPGGMNLQPSEFAKLAFILFAAGFLDRRGRSMASGDWSSFLLVLGAFAGVIYLEPDMGTAMVLCGIAFCMLIAAGVNWKPLLGLVAVAALAVLLLVSSSHFGHQQKRLKSYMNPWAEEYRQEGGYQVTQSWLAMARGGWGGVGLGRSLQKLDGHLPESNTDFIFAILAEELGLVRAVLVLWLFGWLALRGYAIAARAPDRYSALLVIGVSSWIAVQSGLNIAVVTGTVPNTGVPLPFISWGNSSLTALLVAVGLVVGISRRRVSRTKPIQETRR